MPSSPMLQKCLNTVGPSPVRCSTKWIGRRLALPSSFLSRRLRSISGKSRRSSPCADPRTRAAFASSALEGPDRHVAFVHADHVAAFSIFRQIEVPVRLRSDNPAERYSARAVGVEGV